MRVAVLLFVLGCDGAAAVEGDRDGDRIGDEIDPCLATKAELAADLDGDGLTGDADPCPFDAGAADRDGDTVPDACDPFPDLAGDLHRCTMPLTDKALASAIWIPRDQPWEIREGLRTAAATSASIIAETSFEQAATTTFDVRVTLAAEASAAERYFKVWVRSNETPARDDLGCAVAITGAEAWRVVLFGNGFEASAFAGLPTPTEARVQVTVESTPTASSVRCVVTPLGGARVVTVTPEPIVLPPGGLGFGVEDAGAAITGIGIYDRDDFPVFPTE